MSDFFFSSHSSARAGVPSRSCPHPAAVEAPAVAAAPGALTTRIVRAACAVAAAGVVALALPGCLPLVAAGGAAAVAGTGLVSTDRRTTGIQLEDESIEQRTNAAIRANIGDKLHVNVTSYNRQVLLTGEVPTADDKKRVEESAARVENVRAVINELAVMPDSSWAQRSKDTLITGKVKASFVDAKDIYANAFKVVTERGVVYLMGRVSQREATRTAEIARGVSGVVRVVRVYELVSEAELAQIGQQQPPAPALPPAAPTPAPAASAAPAPASSQGLRTESSGAVVTPIR